MNSQPCLKAKARSPMRPQAFTLIETLLAVSFGSSIMLSAVALVHTAFKLQSLTQARVEQASTLDRYVEQFRCDVSLAHRVELPTERTLQLFFVGDQRAEYHADENQITRRSFEGDELRQVERVRLAAGYTARFARSDSGRCVVLDVEEREDELSADAPRTVRQIVIGVGSMNGAGGLKSMVREATAAPPAGLPSEDASPSDSNASAEPTGSAALEEAR